MVVRVPGLPRSHDEEPVVIEMHCICSSCQHFWIETPGTGQSVCPMCSGAVFIRTEHRRPLKQY